jgi:hypothetical protein
MRFEKGLLIENGFFILNAIFLIIRRLSFCGFGRYRYSGVPKIRGSGYARRCDRGHGNCSLN